MIDMVRCRICNRLFSIVNHLHLRSHGTTMEKYREEFPKARTQSKLAIERRETNGGGGASLRKFNKRYNGTKAHRESSKKGAAIGLANGSAKKGGLETARKKKFIPWWGNTETEKILLPFMSGLGFESQVNVHQKRRIAICDFLHHGKMVIVEIDGKGHGTKKDKDRDRKLNAKGYKVLRYTNKQVREEPKAVMSAISQEMKS